jgi:drug/metabolite transporter (DMT)-like permease
MAMVIGGIVWAVAERGGGGARPTASGVWLALGGSLGQACGLVLSKYGMQDYDAFAATQIRVLVGAAGFALLCTAWRWWPRIRQAVLDRPAMRMTAVGAVFGPFLGIGLSLVAIQESASTGVAASIMATTPIMLVPVVILRGERVGIGGIFGAALAVAGVALLLLT